MAIFISINQLIGILFILNDIRGEFFQLSNLQRL